MNTYRLAVNLKLGLIVTAVVIAVASLWYTNQLVERLREREQDAVQLWADAIRYLTVTQQDRINPHLDAFVRMERMLTSPRTREALVDAGVRRTEIDSLYRALGWARTMPPAGEIDFVSDQIIIPNRFDVPAVLVDSASSYIRSFRNVEIDTLVTGADSAQVLAQAQSMRGAGGVIPIRSELEFAGAQYRIAQDVYYGESALVRQLRMFPYVQLFFVSLFIIVGYLGFSYVRRNEQSNLWVGMAKEAAHQLGTPLTSMMGWSALLKEEESPMSQRVGDELEKDIARLQRVANRFSKIGSTPELEHADVGLAVAGVADYIRRRIPNLAGDVTLDVEADEGVIAPLNEELFEWVVENLLKNALDAVSSEHGRLQVRVQDDAGRVHIDVEDNGKGIDKSTARYIFRPGYSTKKRGWGLGLSLAKRIVEDYHGGSLTLLSSKPGEGSVFRITLDKV
ncbi:MAG: HAMP domain-containing sensor histidine kinase [Bacteroidota bacterium]